MNIEQRKEQLKAYYQSHKEQIKEQKKAYYLAHKEHEKARLKAWREANKDRYINYLNDFKKADLNSIGKTKYSIRNKSNYYLAKYGKKIPGYQIHHCCTYNEPYKFIYCSKEMHLLIHSYLREHHINADSDHYEQIKHLLDDTVVKYGIK